MQSEELCSSCFHPEDNHEVMCNASLTCLCEKFNPPYLARFAQEIDKVKNERKSIFARCKYVLEKLPPSRNAGEKTFTKIYNEIWYGFKIRKDGTKMTTEVWKRLPNQDSINREKRRVKEIHESLRTYDTKVVNYQGTIYQALMEMAIEK